MDTIIVIAGAAATIGLIVWWFFGKRSTDEVESKVVSGKQQVTVTVDGGYLPNTVILKQGVPASIIFDRKDSSGCFSHVVFPDFGVNDKLPVGEPHSIDINTDKPGEYNYACGMNMFHGKVVIK